MCLVDSTEFATVNILKYIEAENSDLSFKLCLNSLHFWYRFFVHTGCYDYATMIHSEVGQWCFLHYRRK